METLLYFIAGIIVAIIHFKLYRIPNSWDDLDTGMIFLFSIIFWPLFLFGMLIVSPLVYLGKYLKKLKGVDSDRESKISS